MPVLAKKLTRAREGAGLTIMQAAERMPSLTPQALRHIEGKRKGQPAPSGQDLRHSSVDDLIRAYWPVIKYKDFDDPARPRPPLRLEYEEAP